MGKAGSGADGAAVRYDPNGNFLRSPVVAAAVGVLPLGEPAPGRIQDCATEGDRRDGTRWAALVPGPGDRHRAAAGRRAGRPRRLLRPLGRDDAGDPAALGRRAGGDRGLQPPRRAALSATDGL
ncbi:MAG: hypothetical protein AVDCRST_MAG59-835 [uncultured Thermomicrobiales bacterium]|uniref:Uncharacterized protein n=1 Tax=uncultured Thermomicrobiales bacterium TaxID=1645740 RepID=A0A6J4U5F1_9BACT|nr:MAG: hypothetical protein AVDCRST_MAG59-835 [uncultured Thermomicrobiales bacterium]